MPFPFTLPTTSSVSFSEFFSSSTHPSLPLAATSCRGVVRDALKKHKRLPPSSQPAHLSHVLQALNEYIRYLFAIDTGLSGEKVAGEEVDIVLIKELEVEWRTTLSQVLPGREPPRVKLRSLESELFFVLWSLAAVHCLIARSQLHTLYGATVPTQEQRTAAITNAMKQLIEAHSVYTYLLARSGQWNSTPGAVEISAPVFNALAELAIAEATLITVLKDDPYPSIVIEDRNKNSKDWMFKAPDIPKVRAHLFARLCLASADHAAKAQGMLHGAGKLDDALPRYLDDLRRTARGKACRFLGVDAELSGKAGEAIAWLRGANKELGFASAVESEEGQKVSGLAKLKKNWQEKREDKRVERGSSNWGADGGKFEEGRVVEMLERKWVKMNDTVGMYAIPPSEPLLAGMPSGREYHSPKPFKPPTLDEDILIRMRALPDPDDTAFKGDEDDSGEETQDPVDTPGAFPGAGSHHSDRSSYY